MTWLWKYDVGQKVKVNEKVKWDLPMSVNKVGEIVEQCTSKTFDYSVKLDDNGLEIKVKESEIYIIEER